jgi:hypothetical protein
MKKDVIDKLAALITAAFGLVAALAWNDVIKGLFKGPCSTEGAGTLCTLSSGGPWMYAIVVTILAVFATIWIGKASERAAAKALKEEEAKAAKKKSTKKK